MIGCDGGTLDGCVRPSPVRVRVRRVREEGSWSRRGDEWVAGEPRSWTRSVATGEWVDCDACGARYDQLCRRQVAALRAQAAASAPAPEPVPGPRPRRHVPAATVRRVLAYWGPVCVVCGADYAHIDHATPLALGGADTADNLVPMCAAGNLAKGRMTLAEFRASERSCAR